MSCVVDFTLLPLFLLDREKKTKCFEVGFAVIKKLSRKKQNIKKRKKLSVYLSS